MNAEHYSKDSQNGYAGTEECRRRLEADLAEHMIRLATASYSFEEKRGNILETLTGHLLTCVTILSVAILTPAPYIYEYLGGESEVITTQQVRFVWLYVSMLTPLICALLTILISKIRRKGYTLDSPQNQAKYIIYCSNNISNGNYEQPTGLDLAQNYCDALQTSFDGLLNKNNQMKKALNIAMLLISISCVLILFSIFIIVVETV